MSVRISLIVEASEMFLSLHVIFSLERAAVVWTILERISGLDPFLEMIAPRYLKFSTSSWPFTVKLFDFASDLFSRYSRGRYYRENKSPRNWILAL